MLIFYLGHDQVYVGTSLKNEKEEVALLILKVALFENSSNGEGGADPFLPHSTTHSLHACRLFCRPRSRFQLRWWSPASTFCNASGQMSGTLKMGGENAGDLSFTGERKDWLMFRKRLRKVFDEKNMGWAITTLISSLSKRTKATFEDVLASCFQDRESGIWTPGCQDCSTRPSCRPGLVENSAELRFLGRIHINY